MPIGQVTDRHPFNKHYFRDAEILLEILFRLRFRVILIASWITQNAPIEQHGIHAVKFKITALMNEFYAFSLKADKLCHGQGYCIVLIKRHACSESAAPRIKSPILNLELAMFLYIKRAVVPHPCTVIRDFVPADILMVWVDPCPLDGLFCVGLDRF